MQKKLLALAVAGALAPAAAMAQSSVEIYGRANLGIDQYRATGSTLGTGDFKGRLRVFDGSSRVGFRVNESLGGGMRAFVVVETGVNIDTGSQQGQAGPASGTNASSGFWASRSSWLGLGGGWGDIRFGRQDVFYGNGIIQQTAANYINTAVDGIWTHHGLVAAPGGRLSNVLSYNSPTVGGFNASLYYVPQSEGASYTGTGQDEGRLYALTARYSGGALRGQFDFSKNDNVGSNSANSQTGWKAGVGWAYAPGSQVSFVYGNLQNEAGAAEAEVTIWTLNWEHMIGQWQLMAQYMRAGDTETNLGDLPDSSTTGITLAAKYFLSKRTGVYLSFNQYRNDNNAIADFGPGACLSSAPNCRLPATSIGADPRIIALGVMHNF